MHNDKKNKREILKKVAYIPTGTIVSLRYRILTGRGTSRTIKRIYKVERDCGFHVIFINILNNEKFSLSKNDCIAYEMEIIKIHKDRY